MSVSGIQRYGQLSARQRHTRQGSVGFADLIQLSDGGIKRKADFLLVIEIIVDNHQVIPPGLAVTQKGQNVVGPVIRLHKEVSRNLFHTAPCGPVQINFNCFAVNQCFSERQHLMIQLGNNGIVLTRFSV